MTTSRTHPAAEVPGGVPQEGTLLVGIVDRWDEEEGLPLVMKGVGGIMLSNGMVWHDAAEVPFRATDWAIRLDDPLGLGLAGLAARVMRRLPSGVAPDAALAVLDIGPMHDGRSRPFAWMTLEQKMALASYLALTDRLCAAVGLALEPGEVAAWERRGEVWVLSQPCGGALMRLECEAESRTWPSVSLPDDPLTALRAAVAEVCDG